MNPSPNVDIFTAVENNNIEALKRLLQDPNCDVNALKPANSDKNPGLSPLMIAAKEGFLDILDTLLSTSGININLTTVAGQPGVGGFSALMYAAYHNQPICLSYLLAEKGINMALKDADSCTALDHAIKKQNKDCIGLIIQWAEAMVCAPNTYLPARSASRPYGYNSAATKDEQFLATQPLDRKGP